MPTRYVWNIVSVYTLALRKVANFYVDKMWYLISSSRKEIDDDDNNNNNITTVTVIIICNVFTTSNTTLTGLEFHIHISPARQPLRFKFHCWIIHLN
jgi:hypothetical protein